MTFGEQDAALAHLSRWPPEAEALALLCWFMAPTKELKDALADRWPGALSFVGKSKPKRTRASTNPLLERIDG